MNRYPTDNSHCPRCDSPNIQARMEDWEESTWIDGGVAKTEGSRRVGCEDCGKTWWEGWLLLGWEDN